MVKVTEEKLLAFEAFLSSQKCDKQKAFKAFNEKFDGSSKMTICELLEEKGGTAKLLMFFSR